ncbi:MAG: VCBS repeat-containing protein [Planctomycetota bacterium]
MRLAVLLILAIALPLVALPRGAEETTPPEDPSSLFGGAGYPASPVQFARSQIGPDPYFWPQICNVTIVDFDGDGLQDVVACDGQRDAVLWYRQQVADGTTTWDEQVLGTDLATPAHATVVDIDADGDKDVVVSVLVNIMPDDRAIGSVVVLENTAAGFERHTVLDDVHRVADAQPADFDGDGDVDLAVAVFGYQHGQVMYLENRGNWRFRRHDLLVAPGTIHVPVADYDGDGDPDIAAVVSQDEEEVWGFENLGNGEFRNRRLWFTHNHDIGGAGLVSTDLDGDGDTDLLLPVGDNFEFSISFPQPYHGCLWLENQGDWQFATRRIAKFGGTYAAAPGDVDGDGDQDVVLVSMFNEFDKPGNGSIVWLENNGAQEFKMWQIDDTPTHLVTVACGDLDGDGRTDIVAGGLHIPRPHDRIGRITAWRNVGQGAR